MRHRVQVAMALDLHLGSQAGDGALSGHAAGDPWGQLRIAAPYAKVLGNHFNPEDFLSVSESALSVFWELGFSW